jgi:hypothetical protein
LYLLLLLLKQFDLLLYGKLFHYNPIVSVDALAETRLDDDNWSSPDRRCNFEG